MLWKCRILVDDNVIPAAGELDGVQAFFRVNFGEVEQVRVDFRADDGEFSGTDDVAIVWSTLLLLLFSAWFEALYEWADGFYDFTFSRVIGNDALLGGVIFGGCHGGFIARAEEVSEVGQHAESGMRQNNFGQNDRGAVVSTLREGTTIQKSSKVFCEDSIIQLRSAAQYRVFCSYALPRERQDHHRKLP